jgi:hypothetical protein
MIAGRTDTKDRTMAKARPRKPNVEKIVQLVAGAVNKLIRLLDAIHQMR